MCLCSNIYIKLFFLNFSGEILNLKDLKKGKGHSYTLYLDSPITNFLLNLLRISLSPPLLSFSPITSLSLYTQR